MYGNIAELHKSVKCKKSGGNKKAKVLWALKEAKDEGMYVCDLGSVQKIQTRLDLWAIHLKSPTAVLADALKLTEQKYGPAQSSQ